MRQLIQLASVLCLMWVIGVAGLAQGKNVQKGAEQAQKAATVFREIMGTPDKSVPKGLLHKAECVAVFPQVIKAGFIVGGRGGRGVVSCRARNGWTAPAYLTMGGGSFGLQIGAQSTDFVLLFMNQKAIDSLLKSKFTLGGDASVAAGPVGRAVTAETDAYMNAEILSYSRSKGLFAGLELKGVVIGTDDSDMRDTFGEGVSPRDVVVDQKVKGPAPILVYPKTLARYSPQRAR
jgi:lipid-binding SYLF domain-containing protein